jgi:hypothetical protein
MTSRFHKDDGSVKDGGGHVFSWMIRIMISLRHGHLSRHLMATDRQSMKISYSDELDFIHHPP